MRGGSTDPPAMKTSGTLTVLGLSVFAIAACGGSSETSIPDPTTTSTNGTEPPPADPGATPTTPPAAPTGATPPPSSKPTSAGIACGTATCTSAQECCVSLPTGGGGGGGRGGGGAGADQACVAKGKCAGDVALTCSSAASCGANQVCCLDIDTSGGASTATCKTSCGTGGGAGPRPIQLCATDAECKNGSCKPAQLGLKICATPSSGGGGGGGGGGGKSDGGAPHFDGGHAGDGGFGDSGGM
ncbi:MAG: hypothetical protein JWP87_3239 [Labilithrix sp.]|nr:hypothetical protein [Labilithrix sp.]